jgi:hypothetical protein
MAVSKTDLVLDFLLGGGGQHDAELEARLSFSKQGVDVVRCPEALLVWVLVWVTCNSYHRREWTDGALVFIRSFFPIFWESFWERDKKMQREDRGGPVCCSGYIYLVFFDRPRVGD